jgi:hypothetical protein
MTDGQKFGFYLPVWRRVQEARGWARKPLNLEEEKFRMWPDPAGPLALKVLLFGKQTAATEGRSVAAEDLRRACTLVATAALDARSPGSHQAATISSKHLNNKQVNHLVTLLRLLIDPDDLKAVNEWLHPENAEKAGLIKFIERQAPEGLLITIYRNAYDSRSWREGSMQQLRWLLKQVKGRQKSWHTEPVMAGSENEPF